MDPKIIASLITLAGVVVGLLCRDVIMALFISRQKRTEQIEDRAELRAHERHDVVRLYADPLNKAASSLRIRLIEIIDKGPAPYLLVNTAQTTFVEYKRISTLYRLAALLGWIRAFRRERSYLDPYDSTPSELREDPILQIEKALADGQHVEEQRLDELLTIWKVADEEIEEGHRKILATEIDVVRQDFLGKKGALTPNELDDESKFELVRKCADLISEYARVEIPDEFVRAHTPVAILFLGIKEAYIYRDWQAAIGDFMIMNVDNSPRQFDIMGFGEFERLYIRARNDDLDEKRWIDRIDALFLDLDMTKTSLFDARRQQMINLRDGCLVLEEYLDSKLKKLRKRNK